MTVLSLCWESICLERQSLYWNGAQEAMVLSYNDFTLLTVALQFTIGALISQGWWQHLNPKRLARNTLQTLDMSLLQYIPQHCEVKGRSSVRLNPQNAPHILPSRARYGVSFEYNLDMSDREISRFTTHKLLLALQGLTGWTVQTLW